MTPVHRLGTDHGVRLLCLSDFIDQELTDQVENKQLPPLDLIVSCGDMVPEYLSFLRDRLDAPLVYVKGNHDIRYTTANLPGCENIHARVVSFGSLNILGLEGSMWYNGGPTQYTEAMMRKQIFRLAFRIWRKGPVHMVVTHAPPRHIHDREDLCHRGFECFGRFIKKRHPGYFIHGHVHDHFDRFEERITQVEQTRVINTCGHIIIEV
jgi:Icc-related predicted phosphoesterase